MVVSTGVAVVVVSLDVVVSPGVVGVAVVEVVLAPVVHPATTRENAAAARKRSRLELSRITAGRLPADRRNRLV